MITTDKFVFYRLQKCASRTLAEHLKKEFGGTGGMGHFSVRSKKAEKNNEGKLLVASIRNPWDWYVSWYSFIKNEKSGRFKGLDRSTFRAFILDVMNKKKGNYPSVDFRVMNKLDIGAYSYCFFNILSSIKPSQIDTKKMADSSIIPIDYFIRFEHLDECVKELYKKIGYKNDNAPLPIFNKSRHKDYSEYYDDELVDLICYKDRIIVDRFDYVF